MVLTMCDSWCPWEPFSADNILLLYKKQRRTKWLEVMDLDREILPELKKSPKLQQNIFSHARKLALYPEYRETLSLSGYFVEKTADVLEELIIHANFDALDIGDHAPTTSHTIEARELNDSATAPGLLSSTLFGHMLPFEKCTPFKNLKSLRLHRISLRHCAETWCKFVDFTKMQYLRVYQCSGADSLFGQLSKATNLPKQLKTLEFQHKDNAENEALLALDGFLCLVSGINDLIIDMEHVKSLPAAAGVARHGKTLELLNVHCSQACGHVSTSSDTDQEELVWDLEDFAKICTACAGLEQLSCAWPATSLIRTPSEEWKAYESAIAELNGLVTLHVSTFPSNKPSTQTLPRNIYEQLLQGLALRMFDGPKSTTSASTTPPSEPSNNSPDGENITTSPGTNFRLLAFGISDKIYERENPSNQIIYLRSTCQDALGETKPYAAKIGWCLRQFVEPRSDVLDFVLHRDSKCPWRDRDGPPTGWTDDDEYVYMNVPL